MKKKKLVLKQSIKDLIELIIVIAVLLTVFFIGLEGMRKSAKQYDETYLNQQKMTESVAMNQSK